MNDLQRQAKAIIGALEIRQGTRFMRDMESYLAVDAALDFLRRIERGELVEVVRCQECVYWQDRHIEMHDGRCRDYTPEDEEFVTLNVGINVGAHCTKHGFDNESGSWFWANKNDFCSRGIRKRMEDANENP